MIAKSPIAAAALFFALSAPALAADPNQSAMAGDPNWPATAEVAPSIALRQGPSTPAVTEVDPTWQAPRNVPAGVALRQEPLVDDPLQGYPAPTIRHAAAAAEKSAPTAVACGKSCKCKHG